MKSFGLALLKGDGTGPLLRLTGDGARRDSAWDALTQKGSLPLLSPACSADEESELHSAPADGSALCPQARKRPLIMRLNHALGGQVTISGLP